jgi:hypothetical protein
MHERKDVTCINFSQLNPEQRQKLLYAVAHHRDYFSKLRERMKAQTFPEDDRLFVAVCQAWESAHDVVKLLAEKKPEEVEVETPQWRKDDDSYLMMRTPPMRDIIAFNSENLLSAGYVKPIR